MNKSRNVVRKLLEDEPEDFLDRMEHGSEAADLRNLLQPLGFHYRASSDAHGWRVHGWWVLTQGKRELQVTKYSNPPHTYSFYEFRETRPDMWTTTAAWRVHANDLMEQVHRWIGLRESEDPEDFLDRLQPTSLRDLGNLLQPFGFKYNDSGIRGWEIQRRNRMLSIGNSTRQHSYLFWEYERTQGNRWRSMGGRSVHANDLLAEVKRWLGSRP